MNSSKRHKASGSQILSFLISRMPTREPRSHINETWPLCYETSIKWRVEIRWMSLRSALGLFSAIAPNDHQQQEETDAVHPNGSQSFCHQRHPARHVLANPTLSGHQNQDCPTLSDDHWVCASLPSSNVITKQKSLPQALSSM